MPGLNTFKCSGLVFRLCLGELARESVDGGRA